MTFEEPLDLPHLQEPQLRTAMRALWLEEVRELEAGYARTDWPYGKKFNGKGWGVFNEVMPDALADHDDVWLGQRLRDPSLWHGTKNVPAAARRIAITEFNTAYVRGVASVLIDRQQGSCLVYRAAPVRESSSRHCVRLEGQRLDPAVVFDAHRRSYWPSPDPSAPSIPSGANCTHSIRAVDERG